MLSDLDRLYYQHVEKLDPEYYKQLVFYDDYFNKLEREWKQTLNYDPMDLITKDEKRRYLKAKADDLRRQIRKYQNQIGPSGDGFLEELIGALEEEIGQIARYLWLMKQPKSDLKEITQAEIQRAKAVPLHSLLQTKKAGTRWLATCPFHQDQHPSMTIYENNSWYCFPCGIGGDVIDLVMKKQQLKFPEAVKVLINL